MLDVFVLLVGVEPFAEKGSVGIQLVVQRCLDRLYQLVLRERVESLVLELVRNVCTVESLDAAVICNVASATVIRIRRVK